MIQMKKKKETTTSNRIADSLREAINYGTLKPSDKIIERELAEKYEASHIPVREALRILEGEGFVEIGDEKQKVCKDMLIDSPKNIPHCLYNEGSENFRVLVVKTPKPT